MTGRLLRHDSLTKSDVEDHIGRGRPRMEHTERIVIDTGQNSYKELKELSNNTGEAWRTAANQSNDRRR